MKNHHSLFLKVFAFLLISFPAIQAQVTIPLAQGTTTRKEIKLSQISSHIRYIPLETTAESLLKQDIMDVTFAGGYLFVCDYEKVLQFTPEGKFIRQIGKSGQGPGEYKQNILAITYDEPQKLIFMSDMRQGKVLVFSFDGTFIKDIKTETGATSPHLDADGNLLTVSSSYLYSKERQGDDLFVYNQNGKRLYGFPFHFEEGKRYPQLVFEPALFYSYNGHIYYKNPLELIIYRLDKKKRIPAYRLDLSQYEKLTTEENKLKIDTKNKAGAILPDNKKFIFLHLWETAKNMGIDYAQEDERRFAWYDKQTGNVCRVHSSQADRDGFTDDVEGGYPMLPLYLKNGQLINVISASALLEYVKPSQAKGSLKKVITNLQEDDNQVIQVVDL